MIKKHVLEYQLIYIYCYFLNQECKRNTLMGYNLRKLPHENTNKRRKNTQYNYLDYSS